MNSLNLCCMFHLPREGRAGVQTKTLNLVFMLKEFWARPYLIMEYYFFPPSGSCLVPWVAAEPLRVYQEQLKRYGLCLIKTTCRCIWKYLFHAGKNRRQWWKNPIQGKNTLFPLLYRTPLPINAHPYLHLHHCPTPPVEANLQRMTFQR